MLYITRLRFLLQKSLYPKRDLRNSWRHVIEACFDKPGAKPAEPKVQRYPTRLGVL